MRTRQEMEKLGERIAEMSAHIDAAMHRLLRDIREFDAEGGWAYAGAQSCAHWLAWRIGWDLATAREHVRVARKLGDLPKIDQALRTGKVSYSKVRAMTRVATPATEETLVVWAGKCTAAHLETICRKYGTVQRLSGQPADADQSRRYLTRRVLDDGMVMIQVVLRPEEAALVMAAVEKAAKDVSAETPASAEPPAPDWTKYKLPGNFDRADGLMAIAQSYARGASPDRAPVELIVRTTKDALSLPGNGTADVSAETSAPAPEDSFDELGELADGTWISQHAVRRLACDAGLVELVESPTGEPLSIGRKRRTIPAPMKRALLERDRCCRFPGCTNRLFVQGHHIEHWSDGGETALDNLLLLCSFHHTFVHDHGYTVHFESGEAVFHTPRGYRVHTAPERCRLTAEEMGWPAIRSDNEEDGLDIDPETNEIDWDGQPVNYGFCVEDLAHLDGLR